MPGEGMVGEVFFGSLDIGEPQYAAIVRIVVDKAEFGTD